MVLAREKVAADTTTIGGSLLRMRPLEPGGVTVFESPFTSLQRACSCRILKLFNRALLLKILLSRDVQLTLRRQRRPARRFSSGLLTAFISGAFFRRCTLSRAMSAEHGDATHDDPCQPHQHKQAHLLDHNSRQPRTNLSIYAAIEQRPVRHRSLATLCLEAFLLLRQSSHILSKGRHRGETHRSL
jgi:hypothetical protein